MKMMNLCILSSICLCPACKLRSWVFFVLNRSLWELITTKCVTIWKVGIVKYIRFFFPYVQSSFHTLIIPLKNAFVYSFFFYCSTYVFLKLLKSPSELQTCWNLAIIMYGSVGTGLRVSLLYGALSCYLQVQGIPSLLYNKSSWWVVDN